MTPARESAAAAVIAQSQPRHAALHVFEADHGQHVLVADGSRVYDVDRATARALGALGESGDDALAPLLREFGFDAVPLMAMPAVVAPPLRSLSLAAAQACNLACSYCYAQGGDFGSPARQMAWQVAEAAVRRLFAEAQRGESVMLAFLGGEPLANRALVRRATLLAAELGSQAGVDVRFAITTNGTLLEPGDAEFFERFAFAVTVSLDGTRETHDRLRPFAGGGGSFDRILQRAAPLLALQRRMQVGARVSVTPRNLQLRETVDALGALGFHSVGVSPVLRSPSGQDELGASHFQTLLAEMMRCGDEFVRRTLAGERYPFANMSTAMMEIHRGTHRPYPCGAGASYLGVSAEGELFACHRFVGDAAGALGSLEDGIDTQRQAAWLERRHVDRQEPCRSCWARYLCGGGCHHEVLARGRPACDYIRGWLHYCLTAYVRLLDACPKYFSATGERTFGP